MTKFSEAGEPLVQLPVVEKPIETARDGFVLPCPKCHKSYLHQHKVEVFDRGEDEKSGVHVVIAEFRTEVDSNLKGNPSSRREAINVSFVCENCNAYSTLSIVQHKGCTYLAMHYEIKHALDEQGK